MKTIDRCLFMFYICVVVVHRRRRLYIQQDDPNLDEIMPESDRWIRDRKYNQLFFLFLFKFFFRLSIFLRRRRIVVIGILSMSLDNS